MSQRSNGKERGGRSVFPSLSPIHTSFYSSLNHSLLLFICLPLLPHSLFPPLFFPPFPPPFSIPLSILTSLPPCVVMCNVLKLARSMADRCRYRLISYKSGCSDQLPHRGQTDRKKDTHESRLSERVCLC